MNKNSRNRREMILRIEFIRERTKLRRETQYLKRRLRIALFVIHHTMSAWKFAIDATLAARKYRRSRPSTRPTRLRRQSPRWRCNRSDWTEIHAFWEFVRKKTNDRLTFDAKYGRLPIANNLTSTSRTNTVRKPNSAYSEKPIVVDMLFVWSNLAHLENWCAIRVGRNAHSRRRRCWRRRVWWRSNRIPASSRLFEFEPCNAHDSVADAASPHTHLACRIFFWTAYQHPLRRLSKHKSNKFHSWNAHRLIAQLVSLKIRYLRKSLTCNKTIYRRWGALSTANIPPLIAVNYFRRLWTRITTLNNDDERIMMTEFLRLKTSPTSDHISTISSWIYIYIFFLNALKCSWLNCPRRWY